MSGQCAKPTCSAVAERWFDIAAAQREIVERIAPTPSTIALCPQHAGRFTAPAGWSRLSTSGDVDAIGETRTSSQRPATPRTSTPRTATPRSSTPRTSTPRTPKAETARASTGSRARVHERGTPWFLSLSDTPAVIAAESPTSEHVGVENLSGESTNMDSAQKSVDEIAEPTTGSLLHRAFHGPDRDVDAARANDARRSDDGGSREIDALFPRQEESAVEEFAGGKDIADDTVVPFVGDLSTRRAARVIEDGYDIELPFPPSDSEARVAVS